MNKILVIGSMNMDLVVSTSEIPAVGETVLGNSISEVPGGKGANQAVAIAKLGGDVSFLGKVGKDGFGQSLIESMNASGVQTENIELSDNNTGIAIINVDRKGNNNIVVIPGANFDVDKDYLNNKRSVIQASDLVLFQLEIPLETVKEGLRISKEMGKTTILNPAPAFDLDDDTISFIDILIPNEHELERLAGIEVHDKDDMKKATQVLLDKGVKVIIVTLGSEGVLVVDKNTYLHIPGHVVDVVDTTAAGDSFIGGFATSYVEHKDIKTAIQLGQKTAALSIQKAGAQNSLPTRKEVDQFEG